MNKLLATALLVFSLYDASAQNSKALKEAQQLFGFKKYDQAIPLFLDALNSGTKDPLAYYQAGVCYQRSQDLNNQLKAIPYFENALKDGKGLPVTIYYDLGGLYLRNNQLDKALATFILYKTLTKADKKAQTDANKAINICHNAVALMSVPRDIKVHSFPGNVNSSFTEYNPVVTADERVMAYTALRPNTGRTRSGDKFIESIYVTYQKSGSWSESTIVPVASEYNVGTAGISPDGQKMHVFIGGADDQGSLFQINKVGENWSRPGLITPSLNSKYLETTVSITPDGKVVYFASNRPGGKGGLDIWRTELKPGGVWTMPTNLGPPINSSDNEDAPFIHPDQQTLYFTSDGHNTMGGRDIFQTKLINGKWTNPENMGYPVNTTANDNYFTLIADGTRAYFSSDRQGGQGAQDIYYLDMPPNSDGIPLTMIKGRMLNAETGKPMPARMYVVDKETNKNLEFVYNPDPETGDYLIILPPARTYDIIVETEGFLPYTLNFNVPNQMYFYQLFQQINLKTIKQFDIPVGQEVQVKNAFYDTHQDVKAELRKMNEAKPVQRADLYDMTLDLMAANDKTGIDHLVERIEHNDPIDEVNLDETKNSKIEAATHVYYYDESDESKRELMKVGGKTIFSLPTMVVAEEVKKQKDPPKGSPKYAPAVLAKFAKIFFDAGKSDLKPQYNIALDDLLKPLNQYPGLSVEISGFASSEGTEEFNRELSNKRAITVLDYLNRHGILRRRIVAKGYGVSKEQNTSKEEGRRVEVRLVQLRITN